MSDIFHAYDKAQDRIVVRSDYPSLYREEFRDRFRAVWTPNASVTGGGVWHIHPRWMSELQQFIVQLVEHEQELERLATRETRHRKGQFAFHREQSDVDLSSSDSDDALSDGDDGSGSGNSNEEPAPQDQEGRPRMFFVGGIEGSSCESGSDSEPDARSK